MSTLAERPTLARARDLEASLSEVRNRISVACEASGRHEHDHDPPVLVAVSKYKPTSDIAGAYDAGQRDFGENYVNELLEKAPALPSDIRWHFIGHLQSNKAKALASVKNLHTFHTLTSKKLATALNKDRVSAPSPLNVLLQVNTSGEDSKSGLPPLGPGALSESPLSDDDSLVAVARHVITSCPNLWLTGLMTIGSLENSLSSGDENQDFQTLIRTRTVLEAILMRDFPPSGNNGDQSKWGSQEGGLILSMGMSSDYEAAVRAGSGIVRVGTGIFGERHKKSNDNSKSIE